MKRTAASLSIALILCAGAALPGAAPVHAASPVIRLAAEEGRISLSEAIRIVKDRYGDVTVLKAETKRRGDRVEHRIRFLAEGGRVRTVQVDARTGEIR